MRAHITTSKPPSFFPMFLIFPPRIVLPAPHHLIIIYPATLGLERATALAPCPLQTPTVHNNPLPQHLQQRTIPTSSSTPTSTPSPSPSPTQTTLSTNHHTTPTPPAQTLIFFLIFSLGRQFFPPSPYI